MSLIVRFVTHLMILGLNVIMNAIIMMTPEPMTIPVAVPITVVIK